jgi:hypothetical protein
LYDINVANARFVPELNYAGWETTLLADLQIGAAEPATAVTAA